MKSREDRYSDNTPTWGMSTEELRRLLALGQIPPMAGADGEDDDDEGAGASSGDSGGDDADDDNDNDGKNTDGDDDSDDDAHPDDVLELKRSEYERLRRIAREQDRAAKQREKDERKAKEAQRRKEGQWEELVKEKDEQIQAVEAERDEAKYQLDNFKRRIRVNGAATRLGFKDPEDAFRFLSDEDTEDDTTTERALRRLAKEKSYLVEARRSTGVPVNGGGPALTAEQVKNMSAEEINARWDEVSKAMASG